MQTPGRRIDTAGYKPVHSFEYYGSTSISVTGSVVPTEKLTEDFINLLKELGEDVSLWNGSKGILGRPYKSLQREKRGSIPNLQFNLLKARYLEINRSLSTQKSLTTVRDELERLTKMQENIESSGENLQGQSGTIRKNINSCNVADPETRKRRKALASALRKTEDDLELNRQAAEAIQNKILSTKACLSEGENDFLQRFATLQTLFEADGNRHMKELQLQRFSELKKDVNELETQSTAEVASLLESKRFLIDCKLGLARLYKVESALKSILQNLEDAMDAQKGRPSQSTTTSLPSQIGVDFRLSYVRRLWNAVDPYFKSALPYVKNTSLKSIKQFREVEDQVHNDVENIFGQVERQDTINSVFGESKKAKGKTFDAATAMFGNSSSYGTFSSSSALLPSFSQIELSHALQPTKRITALHTAAASAYRLLNTIYDSQRQWVDEAKQEYLRRSQVALSVNCRLIVTREQFLDMSA